MSGIGREIINKLFNKSFVSLDDASVKVHRAP